MNIEFIKAKNGEDSFTVDSIFFHSSYAPKKEAERFVQGIDFSFNPKIIILIEPGLSHTKEFLKQRFPDAKIGIIRILKELKKDDNAWDFVIDYSNTDELYNAFTKFSEEELLNTQVLCWPVSEKLFFDEIKNIWQSFKQSLEYAKTILITRQYFEKKWLINSVNFFINTKNLYSLNKTKLPVVITASGPSLKNALHILKEKRDSIFIAALSSSLSVLLKNNIIPDVCVSTDGGFWATKHLKKLCTKNVPLLMSAEANVYKKVLEKNPIVPLNYDDGISNKLFEYLNYYSVGAKRNGTVSGTALDLFKNYTDTIYFCGLDLAVTKGYSHTQPNELEIENSCFDTRINTKEKRVSQGQFNTSSLKIYEDWFNAQSLQQKVYRVIDKEYKNNTLGQIKDISSSDFENQIKNENKDLALTSEKITIGQEDLKTIKQKILDFINKNADTDEWKKQLFPLDFVLTMHAKNDEERKLLIEKLNTKNDKIIKKIKALIDAR